MEKKETKVKKFYQKNKEKIAKFAWFVIEIGRAHV